MQPLRGGCTAQPGKVPTGRRERDSRRFLEAPTETRKPHRTRRDDHESIPVGRLEALGRQWIQRAHGKRLRGLLDEGKPIRARLDVLEGDFEMPLADPRTRKHERHGRQSGAGIGEMGDGATHRRLELALRIAVATWHDGQPLQKPARRHGLTVLARSPSSVPAAAFRKLWRIIARAGNSGPYTSPANKRTKSRRIAP